MFRTKKSMQQEWDACIISYGRECNDQLNTARRIARWSARIPWWELRLPLNRWETTCRAAAADATVEADRMVLDPDNPRNGGDGGDEWKPGPGFWEVFTVREVASTLLWLAYSLLVGIAVMAGVLILIIGRNRGVSDSPMDVLYTLAAIAAGVWSVLVFQWACHALAAGAGLALRYVWGPR
jgi:hypothetical protein